MFSSANGLYVGAEELLLCSEGLVGLRQCGIRFAVLNVAGCSEQAGVFRRFQNNNAVAGNNRRVFCAPLAGVTVEEEQNAVTLLLQRLFVIKGDAAAAVLVGEIASDMALATSWYG